MPQIIPCVKHMDSLPCVAPILFEDLLLTSCPSALLALKPVPTHPHPT